MVGRYMLASLDNYMDSPCKLRYLPEFSAFDRFIIPVFYDSIMAIFRRPCKLTVSFLDERFSPCKTADCLVSDNSG